MRPGWLSDLVGQLVPTVLQIFVRGRPIGGYIRTLEDGCGCGTFPQHLFILALNTDHI